MADTLKLTDAELETVTDVDFKTAHSGHVAEYRAAADAGAARAAWMLYEKLEASNRHLEGDVIGPLWVAGYWAGWDSARDALKRHTEAAGLPRPEEAATTIPDNICSSDDPEPDGNWVEVEGHYDGGEVPRRQLDATDAQG